VPILGHVHSLDQFYRVVACCLCFLLLYCTYLQPTVCDLPIPFVLCFRVRWGRSYWKAAVKREDWESWTYVDLWVVLSSDASFQTVPPEATSVSSHPIHTFIAHSRILLRTRNVRYLQTKLTIITKLQKSLVCPCQDTGPLTIKYRLVRRAKLILHNHAWILFES
jgi:hypothetical protein